MKCGYNLAIQENKTKKKKIFPPPKSSQKVNHLIRSKVSCVIGLKVSRVQLCFRRVKG